MKGRFFIVETLPPSALASTETKSSLDDQCRYLVSMLVILSSILQKCMNEFIEHDTHYIARCIENNPLISQVDADTGELIKGRTNDISIPNKGKNTMDIVTEVHVPSSDGTKFEKRIVNVEIQDNYYPGYPLENREEYYGSVLLMMQKGREFSGMDYAKLKKVYTIWIRTSPPDYCKNTIFKREMKVEELSGKQVKDAKEGLVTIVQMNLGKPEECTGVLRLLAVLLSNKLKAEEKQRIMEEEFGIEFTEHEKEEVNKMCDIANRIEREALNKGRDEGLGEGMVTLLLNQLKTILKEVSDELVQTLRKSSKEKLEELSVKILSITTEKEVLHILNA